jgi:NADH:ubiquinone oxidoreductase subunit 2 (subunit N)
VLSLAYYLRIAGPMAFGVAEERPETLGRASGMAMAVATVAILALAVAAGVIAGATGSLQDPAPAAARP